MSRVLTASRAYKRQNETVLNIPQGYEITEKFCLSCGKVSEKLHVRCYFCLSATVSDIRTCGNRRNFSLSFGRVPKIVTCKKVVQVIPDIALGDPCKN